MKGVNIAKLVFIVIAFIALVKGIWELILILGALAIMYVFTDLIFGGKECKTKP